MGFPWHGATLGFKNGVFLVSGVARGRVGARSPGRRPWGRTSTLFAVLKTRF